MLKIGPSIMCANLLNLKQELDDLKRGGADWIHIDIMDGHFVPGFTFGVDAVKQITEVTDLPIELHLMSDKTFDHIIEFLQTNPNRITIHPESSFDILRCILTIKNAGVNAGIAINPSTPISQIEELLNYVDWIIIMSVNPGFKGQKLLETSLEKAQKLRKLIEKRKLTIELILDGGVKIENLKYIANYGLDGVVIGTGIFQRDCTENAVKKAKEIVQTF